MPLVIDQSGNYQITQTPAILILNSDGSGAVPMSAFNLSLNGTGSRWQQIEKDVLTPYGQENQEETHILTPVPQTYSEVSNNSPVARIAPGARKSLPGSISPPVFEDHGNENLGWDQKFINFFLIVFELNWHYKRRKRQEKIHQFVLGHS
jgi:hypothetical protein